MRCTQGILIIQTRTLTVFNEQKEKKIPTKQTQNMKWNRFHSILLCLCRDSNYYFVVRFSLDKNEFQINNEFSILSFRFPSTEIFSIQILIAVTALSVEWGTKMKVKWMESIDSHEYWKTKFAHSLNKARTSDRIGWVGKRCSIRFETISDRLPTNFSLSISLIHFMCLYRFVCVCVFARIFFLSPNLSISISSHFEDE